MRLNSALQSKVGLDLRTFTRSEVMEIHSTEIIEAVGKALNVDVSTIVADLVDITGLQLLSHLSCDLGSPEAVLIRLTIQYDWDHYRMTIMRDGERVAMVTVPDKLTFPAIRAQAEALEKLIRGICGAIDTRMVEWTYTPDPLALEKRGRAWIRERLNTSPKSAEKKARYDGFNPERTVRQTLADSPHQTLLVSFSKEL